MGAVLNKQGSKQRGFTLVELAIVIVIIGVLASFGVPRFRDAVERSKAGESMNYLSAVRAARRMLALHSRGPHQPGRVTTMNQSLPISTTALNQLMPAGKDFL